MTPGEVTVDAGGGAPDTTITAEPSPLLLWLWGRASGSAVALTGDRGVADRLRKRLAFATQ